MLIAATPLLAFPQSETMPRPDSTGLPGDHFSLEAALFQFQQATSIEDFEQRINTEANGVNNLDLDGNGETDYVRVEDHAEGDAHAFVLQVPVSEAESQDIAVIELEKNGAESAVVQIVGDEEVYGEPYIVEPSDVGAAPVDKGGRGPDAAELRVQPVVVNVWLWPSVRFVYASAYRPWVSPWRYRVYPGWWRPWRPLPWRRHWALCAPHRAHFRPCPTHRVVVAHRIYTPHRRTSVVVVNRYAPARSHYHAHRVTVVKGPRGRNKAVVVHRAPRGRRR